LGTSHTDSPPVAPRAQFLQHGDFYGECVHSVDGRFTLAWRDADDTGDCVGSRKSGSGKYILLEGKRLLVEGRAARPNDGKVANNGTFIINDWGFGDGLTGTFLAFKVQGMPLLTIKFKANLYTNGLSPDGRFAVCQTLQTPYEPHNTKLFLFDLVENTRIANWTPETGKADAYEFPEPGIIRLKYRNIGGFNYTHSGIFLDRSAYEMAMLLKGGPVETLEFIQKVFKGTSGEIGAEWAEKLLVGTERILTTLPSSDDARLASAHRYRGQCLEGLGKLQEALICYDKALALKPAIGVKGRADKLRNKLSVV